MANANTPYIAKAAAPLVNPTTATIFTQVPNTLSTIAATSPVRAAFVKYSVFGEQNQSGTAAGVSANQNCVPFGIRAAGRVTGGTTTNFTPILYLATSMNALNPFTTPGVVNPTYAPITLATFTAAPFNTASGNFYLSAVLNWDMTSGQINGQVSGFAGAGGAQTLIAPTSITPQTGQILTPQPTSVAQSGNYLTQTGELSFFFALGGVFSASNAANTAYLDLFEAEEI